MNLKIFKIEQIGETVIVMPDGEGSAFRYRDLHVEANVIRAHMLRPGQHNLIIDLNKLEYFGSELIGSFVSMLRETKTRQGVACFCCVRPQMIQVLSNMSLFKLWPHYESREAALAATQDQGQA